MEYFLDELVQRVREKFGEGRGLVYAKFPALIAKTYLESAESPRSEIVEAKVVLNTKFYQRAANRELVPTAYTLAKYREILAIAFTILLEETIPVDFVVRTGVCFTTSFPESIVPKIHLEALLKVEKPTYGMLMALKEAEESVNRLGISLTEDQCLQIIKGDTA